MSDMKHTLSLLAAAVLLTACTQDEQPSFQGEMLTFTASIEGGSLTRATVDNTWSGDETVALQINAGGWLDYTADAYGNLTGNDYYWQNTDPVTVQGICPATAAGSTTWSVVSDQSSYQNYQSGDLLATEVTTVNYGNAANLTFRHQTAKLVVNIVDGPIVPDNPEVTVGGNGLALTGTFTKPSSGSSFGTWTPGAQNGSITPYRLSTPNTVAGKNIKVSYAALAIPQSLKAGTKLISILINGQLYTYELPLDITWKPGCVYTYTITVRAGLVVSVDDTIQDWTDGGGESGNATDLGDGYTVSEDGNTYTVYTANGLLAWNEAAQSDYTLNCTLTADIDLTGKEWTPVGNSGQTYNGTFDGQGHTITGLNISSPSEAVALFHNIGGGGKVMNLQLKDVTYKGSTAMGGIAHGNNGTITACSVMGTLTNTTNNGAVGGIAAINYGTITACWFNGTITGGSNVGGIAVFNFNAGSYDGKITACYWSGDGISDGVWGGYDTSGTTKVDNSTVTWQTAVGGMNAALTGNDYQWKLGANSLPVLQKNQ